MASARLAASNVLSITQPDVDDHTLQREPSLKSPNLLDVFDVDGVPLSPLQRIASGLHPDQQNGPMSLVIPAALSAVALRLDLHSEASPLANSSGAVSSSLFTPENARSWGPPLPIIHGTTTLTHGDSHVAMKVTPPVRVAVTPASSSFAAHTTRKANLPYESFTTPPAPVNIAVVATESFTSFYPNSHAAELECSRCEALMPTTSAFCHSCGGSIVVPIIADHGRHRLAADRYVR